MHFRYLRHLAVFLTCISAGVFFGSCSSVSYTEPPPDTYYVASYEWKADGAPVQVRGAVVGSLFFKAARVPTALGRNFTPEEYETDTRSVVLIGHKFWKEKLNSDPTAIGKTVRLNGQNVTIIGVLPASFAFPPDADIWVPRRTLSQ